MRPAGVSKEHDDPLRRRRRTDGRRQDGTLDNRPLLLMLLLTAATPAAVDAQLRVPTRAGGEGPGIVGVVVDRISGRPLEGAAVAVELLAGGADTLAAPAPVVTDPSGRFVFDEIADGRYRIEIDRIGYRTLTDSMDYQAALGLRIDVQMVEDVVELEPLLVIAEARSLQLESAGFYDRRRRGNGRFVTREEIVTYPALRVSDLLRTMPGVRMRGAGVLREEVVVLRGNCVADIYVDGVRLAPPAPVDLLLSPRDLDALEVYQASEVPARFRTTGCGAVVFWTHTPNPGTTADPFTWRKVLAVGGFLGLALFLMR